MIHSKVSGYAFALATMLVQLLTTQVGSSLAASPPVPTVETVRTRANQEVASGRIIVGFHPGVTVAERQLVHGRASARMTRAARTAKTVGPAAEVIEFDGRMHPEDVIHAYRQDPRVRYAEPDFVKRAVEIPNDQYYNSQWGLARVQAAVAWDVTRGSESLLIAVLDTGIDDTVPDLAGKVVASRGFAGGPATADGHGHGTHVAGIAAANTNNGVGVAGMGYRVRLLNGKVLDDNGEGFDSWVAEGVRWAADNGAKVINMSLAGPGPISTTLQDAVDFAWGLGVVVVAAAGNVGTNEPQAPACGANVVAVASVDSADAKSSFSSYGDWVDLAAPGENIYSTFLGGSYRYLMGTSMAAPFVSGLTALLWTTDYGVSAESVVARLKDTANPISGTGEYWESGRIDAAAAMAGLLPYWDVNEDHVANISDITLIGKKWLRSGPEGWIREDARRDGVVNISDIVYVGSHWLYTW